MVASTHVANVGSVDAHASTCVCSVAKSGNVGGAARAEFEERDEHNGEGVIKHTSNTHQTQARDSHVTRAHVSTTQGETCVRELLVLLLLLELQLERR